jgi:hypothetical protein
MVNIKKLADRAKVARRVVEQQVEQQGGTEALKAKGERLRGIAKGGGSMSERAKAAAQVAREKPNPANEVAGDDASGPIGGGAPPPER